MGYYIASMNATLSNGSQTIKCLIKANTHTDAYHKCINLDILDIDAEDELMGDEVLSIDASTTIIKRLGEINVY